MARVVFSGTTVDTTGNQAVYVRGRYRRTLDAPGTYEHELYFLSRTAYQAALTTLTTTRRLTFQTGLDVGGKVSWSPTQTQVLISYKGDAASANMGSQCYTLTLLCGDLLSAARIRSRTRAWTGGPDVILSGVGSEIGFTPNIEASSSAAITLLQCGVTDLDFIKRVVLDYYVDQLASDTAFAAHGDVLLAGSTGWTGWPAYSLSYPGSGASDLEHQDHGGENPGTALVLGINYNPLTGVVKQATGSASTITVLANTTLPGDPDSILEEGSHTAASANRSGWWSLLRADAALTQVGTMITVTGPDWILPGALLTLATGSTTDPMNGTYQVAGVVTEIRGGEAKSRLQMRRAQLNASTGTATGVPPAASQGSASLGTGGATIPIKPVG